MALLEDAYRHRDTGERGGVIVRAARLADAPALAHLLTELGYPQNAEAARSQLSTWAGDPRGIVLLAQSGGLPAGVIAAQAISCLERPGAFARVVALAVEAWAAEVGCRDVEITSSRRRDSAHAFYEALGFADQCERSARYKRPLSTRSH